MRRMVHQAFATAQFLTRLSQPNHSSTPQSESAHPAISPFLPKSFAMQSKFQIRVVIDKERSPLAEADLTSSDSPTTIATGTNLHREG